MGSILSQSASSSKLVREELVERVRRAFHSLRDDRKRAPSVVPFHGASDGHHSIGSAASYIGDVGDLRNGVRHGERQILIRQALVNQKMVLRHPAEIEDFFVVRRGERLRRRSPCCARVFEQSRFGFGLLPACRIKPCCKRLPPVRRSFSAGSVPNETRARRKPPASLRRQTDRRCASESSSRSGSDASARRAHDDELEGAPSPHLGRYSSIHQHGRVLSVVAHDASPVSQSLGAATTGASSSPVGRCHRIGPLNGQAVDPLLIQARGFVTTVGQRCCSAGSERSFRGRHTWRISWGRATRRAKPLPNAAATSSAAKETTRASRRDPDRMRCGGREFRVIRGGEQRRHCRSPRPAGETAPERQRRRRIPPHQRASAEGAIIS